MRNIIIFSVQTYLFPIKVCTHDHGGFYAALITNLKFEGHSLFQGYISDIVKKRAIYFFHLLVLLMLSLASD